MLIMPPSRPFKRARTWSAFERVFGPITRDDGSLLWDTADICWPVDDPRHFWTVVEGDSGGLYLIAGLHLVNRLGYLCCEHGWGGAWSAHPSYRYD